MKRKKPTEHLISLSKIRLDEIRNVSDPHVRDRVEALSNLPSEQIVPLTLVRLGTDDYLIADGRVRMMGVLKWALRGEES